LIFLDLISSFLVFEKKPADWIAPLVGAGVWGHRAPDRYSIEHGVGMLVAGLVPTGRISLLNEPGCKTNLDVN
jgi:hypothetical protein